MLCKNNDVTLSKNNGFTIKLPVSTKLKDYYSLRVHAFRIFGKDTLEDCEYKYIPSGVGVSR